uniref:Kringle-like domain-containing protein n=1 Tax=Wuchereria bancrofti TaxID=6293 RepID=A0A1I8EWY0_WUCBA
MHNVSYYSITILFANEYDFHVECIPTAHLKDYLYYGNVSTYIRGSLPTVTTPLSGRCEVWKNVISAMTKWAVDNGFRIYPDEFMNHNNCRNFDLTVTNNDNNRHLATHMKIIKPNASAIGPWCYAYDHVYSKYYVARCFPECVGSSYQGTTISPHMMSSLSFADRTRILAPATAKPNYNTRLIDAIAIKAFSKYEWGPSTYYDSRPSNLLLSAEFEKNRYSIFFAMIAVGMTIMICSISFVIARNYIKTKERKLKQEEIKGNIAEKVQSVAKKSATPVALPVSNAAGKLKRKLGTSV